MEIDGTDGTLGDTVLGFFSVEAVCLSVEVIGGSLTLSPVLKIRFLSTETLCQLGQ